MSRPLTQSGDRFGRLVVLKRIVPSTGPHSRFSCQCDCGRVVEVVGRMMRSGQTNSCGCLRKESAAKQGVRNRTHGHSNANSPTYRTWHAMLVRCYNEKRLFYKDYGGRGITACDRWRNSFETFLSDMGERPAGKTLDRFPNNDGNYEPGNCRWATAKEQASNRRPRA